MLKRIGWGALALVLLVAIGLATWEPLLAPRYAAPPAHRYDSVIARDTWGVPHIFGKTDPDVAYGVAYAHAEDDFATLQEALAMTRGRLGALTGADGAKTDYALHLLGARATVDRDYAAQPADVRALLDGYASGLNAYAARHPGEVKLARLFPVTGPDVVTGFVLRSPFFFGLDQTLGALVGDVPLPAERAPADAAVARDIAPAPFGSSEVENARRGGLGRFLDFARNERGREYARNERGRGQARSDDVRSEGWSASLSSTENGSNAFLVAPKRAADGATRLVSNSHQPWRGAVAWYELVVHSGTGWNFAGATFPGVPFPVLGHNATLGWTNTVNRPDLTDVYRLTLNEAGDAYRFDGRWLPLEARRVWLRVKIGPFVLPIPRTVKRALHGPVVENKQGAFAIRYAGADQVRMVEQYYRITRARDFAEWNRAMALQGVPATNFLYADRAGTIAHVYNAMVPVRKPGFDYAGVLPGDRSAAFARGTVPYAAYPRNVNPASGFLINANNAPYLAAGAGSEIGPQPVLLGVEQDTTNRAVRSVELLSADRSITAAELDAIKYDTAVSRRSWAGAWFADLAAADARGDAGVKAAQALLARWDWNFDGRGPADTLAALLLRTGNKWHYQRRPRSDPREALVEAAAYLTKHFGRLDVPLGTALRLRQGAVDLPLDGGPDVLRAMALWDEGKDGRLLARHGDSFTMFVEWDRAGAVSSRSIQPFGAATTRPESKHYADQAALFASHRTKPVWFRPQDLRGHVERVYRP